MAITSLLIDSVEYLSKLRRDKMNRLSLQVESSLNDPTSSYYIFHLDNVDGLEDTFLNQQPYDLFGEGFVELYNDSTKVFEGYIDKDENTTISPDGESLRIKAIGKEKSISKDLSEYDISQVFYNYNASYPVSQRGGRATGDKRLDYDSYIKIRTLLQTMFGDLGYSYVINFNNYALDQIAWKYNQSDTKYGDIEEIKETVKIYYQGFGGSSPSSGWKPPVSGSNIFINYAEVDKFNGSYNSFIKQFAQLYGCVFFYNYVDGKLYFHNRDYATVFGKSSVTIDDLILRDNYSEKYFNAPDGLLFNFDDVTLMLKVDRSGGSPVYSYGVQAPEYKVRDLGGNFILEFGQTGYYILGPNSMNLDKSLFINNGIDIKLNGNLSDYFNWQWSLSTYYLKDWLDDIHDNYNVITTNYKGLEVELDGLYFPPIRISYNSTNYNVYVGEVDFNKETTKIKFEYN